MNRLIVIPQLRMHLRYQDWWSWAIPRGMETYFNEVISIYPGNDISPFDGKDFAAKDKAIEFEFEQIKEFKKVYKRGDYVLVCDLSFPGFFHNIFHHIHCDKAYCICHATSLNSMDYFNLVKDSKSIVELGHSKLYEKIFVATEYHKAKLAEVGYDNVMVTALPPYPFSNRAAKENFPKKEIDIISVARNNIQKVDITIEEKLEKDLDIEIYRNVLPFMTWGDYFETISKAKVMLITSKEETFGYQVLDAVFNGCIPLAPNKFSYPELLYDRNLYSSYDELVSKIKEILTIGYPTTVLRNEIKIDNFYRTIAREMLGYEFKR